MTIELVTIELLRPVSREGRMLEPGSTLRVSLAEADSMFRLGFALPAGATLAHPRRKNWVAEWRG